MADDFEIGCAPDKRGVHVAGLTSGLPQSIIVTPEAVSEKTGRPGLTFDEMVSFLLTDADMLMAATKRAQKARPDQTPLLIMAGEL